MPKAVRDLKARYSTSGNGIIPNTFQHPNVFVDKLMYLLTPVENTVLTYAVRRILGFQANIFTRRDNISLSQFTDGLTSQNGEWLSRGCGVGTQAVINALEALCIYKILIPTTDKPDPKRGQEYWLQDDDKKIDWKGLERRLEEKSTKYRKQTQKARYSVEQRGSVEQTAKPSVEQTDGTLLNRDTKPTETHGNPEEHGADAPPKTTKPPKANQIPEVVLFREVTKRYPPSVNNEDVVKSIKIVSERLGREVTRDDLLPFYKSWCHKGYKPVNLAWLEWAETGEIPQNGNWQSQKFNTDGLAKYFGASNGG